MAKSTDMAQREERGLTRPEPYGSPFRTLESFADEVDRVFSSFGLGRGWTTPRAGWSQLAPIMRHDWAWAPEVEIFHRNHDLVVRADLPGMTRDDIKVDVTDDRLTIQGERKHEQQEEKEGMYRSERSYGKFCREIPLPTGTLADQAKASFKNGVLEVTMPAPPESVRRGRRLDISDSPAGSTTKT